MPYPSRTGNRLSGELAITESSACRLARRSAIAIDCRSAQANNSHLKNLKTLLFVQKRSDCNFLSSLAPILTKLFVNEHHAKIVYFVSFSILLLLWM